MDVQQERELIRQIRRIGLLDDEYGLGTLKSPIHKQKMSKISGGKAKFLESA